ncbi:hypothetical protein K9L67_00635 [Candidatus Woesearchaeota archaeon]|nr:hypothetical protein [Candidatus Woesearchaeota archaeon]MCF7900713.1 hypothetical protein [Candidatus Woesearchaeota archaeon]MCF8013234.1 hypothetical protein [Candidatus Woesearchaeota archaeon]
MKKINSNVVVQINVGKNGISQNTFVEIQKNLSVKKDVKVKFLKSFIDSNDRKSAKDLILENIKNAHIYSTKLTGNVLLISHKVK